MEKNLKFNKKEFFNDLANKVFKPWVDEGNEPIKTYEDERWDDFIEYAIKKLNLDKEDEEIRDQKIDLIIDSTVNLFVRYKKKIKENKKPKGKIKPTKLYEIIRKVLLKEQDKKLFNPDDVTKYNIELEKVKKTVLDLKKDMEK